MSRSRLPQRSPTSRPLPRALRARGAALRRRLGRPGRDRQGRVRPRTEPGAGMQPTGNDECGRRNGADAVPRLDVASRHTADDSASARPDCPRTEPDTRPTGMATASRTSGTRLMRSLARLGFLGRTARRRTTARRSSRTTIRPPTSTRFSRRRRSTAAHSLRVRQAVRFVRSRGLWLTSGASAATARARRPTGAAQSRTCRVASPLGARVTARCSRAGRWRRRESTSA